MEQTLSRVNIYGLLSRILLQELDVATFKTIKNDAQIMEFFPALSEWKPLNEFDEAKLLDEFINPDYVNLFVLHLIPYETFYTRDDQMIETGGANPVTDMYSAYDFMVDFEVARTVSSDHIGVEMEFMHHLAKAELKAREEGDTEAIAELLTVQKEFLNKHLLRWAPMFLINVKYEARTPLYYDAADMALEFILSDNEYLVEATKN
jgi:TorA maturation chaperone TorD